eukprot:1161636-Pelagomonas_calceolata.AAC.6
MWERGPGQEQMVWLANGSSMKCSALRKSVRARRVQWCNMSMARVSLYCCNGVSVSCAQTIAARLMRAWVHVQESA